MLKSTSLILISLFIILSHILFIVVNYYSARSSLNSDIKQWALEQQQVFDLTVDEKATSMQQIATYVANDPLVQRLFLRGKRAHDRSAPDNPISDANIVRKALYRAVNPSWQKMTSQYDVRQLHFHLGPGSTSFLRVHRPEKFGDNMDSVRFTVVDANQNLTPTKGFETGRVYSGIRGVVPVFSVDEQGGKIHVGALEAGTSFHGILSLLKKKLHCNFAVLLHEQHVMQNMWPAFVDNHFKEQDKVGSLFIEDITTVHPDRLFRHPDLLEMIHSGHGSKIMSLEDTWQVCIFPLRDYRGQLDKKLADAGVVVVWKEAEGKWNLFRQGIFNNILFATASLVFVQITLVLGWHFSQNKLKAIINSQTEDLQKLAMYDGLTGIKNRRAIEDTLFTEVTRSHRYDKGLAIIIFDLDHFKGVNDTFGHSTGDTVLKETVNIVQQHIRESDSLGRWGGEEFLIVTPETSPKHSGRMAERIRKAISSYSFKTAGSITISLGVASLRENETSEQILNRADEALYRAKEKGRNRVEISI